MTDKEISNYHKVISDPVRWKIIELIKFTHGVTLKDLMVKFNLTKPTLSFHMKKIIKAKIVTTIKKNKVVYYYPNKDTLEQIYGVMENMVHKATKNKFDFHFTEEDVLNTYLLYSDPVRFGILNLIIDKPAISGKEIKAYTGESEANVSFHLDKLIKGNVVIARKIGNQRYYWANEGFLIAFHNFIGKTRNKDVWAKTKKLKRKNCLFN